MGIFKRKKEKKENNYYIIKEFYTDNLSSVVRSYARSIYNIPEVRIAIETMADIISTIPIYHKIEKQDGTAKYLNDDISFVLALKPNALQNANQFWKSVATQLLLNSNIFIEPIYDRNGKLNKLYPLPAKSYEFSLEGEKAFVRFYDKPQGRILEAYDMDNLVYFNRFSALDGGRTADLGLYETVIQALSNQILKITDPKKVKALLQGKQGQVGNLKPKDAKGTMEKFKTSLDENVDGVAYIDPMWEIHDVNWQENDVNRELMQMVINTVYNYFKLTDSIIQHKASEIERENFIADSIKPITDQFEKELTFKLFTQEEINAGHKIEFDVFALSTSTIQAKNTLFATASRNGILNIDEMRELIGQPSLPDKLGKKYRVSADCVDIKVVDDYQIGKVSKNLLSTQKQSEDIENKQKEKEVEKVD